MSGDNNTTTNPERFWSPDQMKEAPPEVFSNPQKDTGTLSEAQRAKIVENLISNTVMSRQQMIDRYLDPRRDIDKECGYRKVLGIKDFKEMYEREPIAARVVNVIPAEVWQHTPEVYEAEDEEEETAFEKDWKDVAKDLRGTSRFKTEAGVGNPIWSYFRRAHQAARLGTFGLMLFGIDDGRKLDQPVAGIKDTGEWDAKAGAGKQRKLLYIRIFDESHVNIEQFEEDETNPRFGLPTKYRIQFNVPTRDADVGMASQGYGLTLDDQLVHWTRVIHVVDDPGSNETFSHPALRTVWNRVYDLFKVFGGAAEAYWRGGFPGISLETHPNLGGEESVEIDHEANKAMMERYMNGLQRYLALVGMTAKTLTPNIQDPTAWVKVAITSICIYLGIPERIFMGSERGELASSQDDGNWNDRKKEIMNSVCTPQIIVPAIDRLCAMRVLSLPESYRCEWPDLDALTDAEKAEILAKRADAMSKYVTGGLNVLMSEMDFLTREMGFTQAEAEEIVKNAAERQEEIQEEQAALADENAQMLAEAGLAPQDGEVEGKGGTKTRFGQPAPLLDPAPAKTALPGEKPPVKRPAK